MTALFDDTPEFLAELRTQVEDWVERAANAVKSFHNPQDHSFWRDSRKYRQVSVGPQNYHLSTTTTSRAYLALACADRCLSRSDNQTPPEWANWFAQFVRSHSLCVREQEPGNQHKVVVESDSGEPHTDVLNTFDIAHVADLDCVAEYVRQFYGTEQIPRSILLNRCTAVDGRPDSSAPEDLPQPVGKLIAVELSKVLGGPGGGAGGAVVASGPGAVNERGEMAFERDERECWVGHHYFVTLHSLRAMAILKQEPNVRGLRTFEGLIVQARKFCVEQCFHAQRGMRFEQDPVRLVFAAVLYCLYARQVDGDLCVAVIEALAAAQQKNGSWPATHPIFRGRNLPWHITSHEVALCLTWLYFQPRLPDSARPLLLEMMRKYFLNWVVPTFIRVREEDKRSTTQEFEGWFDDHTISGDTAIGWATAIVCHFLVNYHSVLSNHINRRVVECLGIQEYSAGYLIDDNLHAKSPRWSKTDPPAVVPATPESDAGASEKTQTIRDGPARLDRVPLATWPDLPPFAWPRGVENANLARQIRWHWSDPSKECDHSKKLAERVLAPILRNPAGRPPKRATSGMLPGEPGTRKTTLVEALARVLDWPKVAVPASVIFDRGFDLMEARANEVFRRLNYLRGCVVFFDEFEEFFCDRGEVTAVSGTRVPPAFPIHDRTIAAFTTSAMLPRLQELHDQNRCLIFLATNHPEKIDPAIKRAGRFDFKLEIRHPKRDRVLEYLDSPAKKTFESLGITVDDDTHKPRHDESRKRFARIIKPVKDAILELFGEDETIRFIDAERALQEVANEPEDAQEPMLVERVRASLLESRERATRHKDPPDLE